MEGKKEDRARFISPHDLRKDEATSVLKKYKDISVGSEGYKYFIKYEMIQFILSNLAGAPGLYLRQKFYKFLFKKMGNKTVIGRGICLRQPKKISIGKGCIIDDYSRITVSGSEEAGINISNYVFLGPYSILTAKNARIEINDYANIGSHCRIGSKEGKVRIGKYALIASFCYVGAGRHVADDINRPMALQGFESKGGVVIEDDVWIGANVIILDGVKVGKGSIIGTGSVVLKDIPPYSIAYGIPAVVVKDRRKSAVSG